MALVERVRGQGGRGAQEEPCDCLTEEGLALIATCPTSGANAQARPAMMLQQPTRPPLVDLSQITLHTDQLFSFMSLLRLSLNSMPNYQRTNPRTQDPRGCGPQMITLPRLLVSTFPPFSF